MNSLFLTYLYIVFICLISISYDIARCNNKEFYQRRPQIQLKNLLMIYMDLDLAEEW